MAKKLQILRGTTAQNDAYTGSIGELTMDTEKVEVRIHDGTTQGGKTIGSSGGASLPILTHVFSDHKLEDMSWLNADTFNWQSGDVYIAAYNHLEKDAESGGLYYRWSTRSDAAAGYNRNIKTRTPTVGEKFYTATAEGWVDTGVTVAQIIDENTVVDSEGATLYWLGNMTNLPADRKEETISGTTVTYFQAEDGHKICLPDQEANVQALYEATGVAWYYILDTENKQFKLPREHKDGKCLYFYVGNFEQSALEQTAGLNAELFNGKADTSSVQALESRTDALEERDYVVASQIPTSSNNYTWYRKYKSGWVEQGVAALISGGDAIVITLPVPMSSINYNISLSQYNGDTTAPNLNRLSFYNQTATGFSVISRYTSSNAARSFLWQVCGQAA